MKSPLVEALRQASGNNSSAEPEEAVAQDTVAAEPATAAPADQRTDADDLQLEESSGVPASDEAGILPIDGPGILPIDGPGILPIDGPGILPIDGSNGPADDEADAEFYETSSLQVANHEATDVAAADDRPADPTSHAPATRAGGRTGMPRLGLYSPGICLLLVAVAACTDFVYQKIAGQNQNPDLVSPSSQLGIPRSDDVPDSTESERPTSRFELIVGPQTAAQDNARPDSARLQSALGARLSDTENPGR